MDGLYFSGAGSEGTLGSTINLAVGQTISFTFRSKFPSGELPIFASADDSDIFSIVHASPTSTSFRVTIDGSAKTVTASTVHANDGLDHLISIQRVGTNFVVTVDGVSAATCPATSGTFSIDKFVADTLECEISGTVTINTSIYLITAEPLVGGVLVDTVNGNDITLASVTQVMRTDWEWVGEFSHTDREYSTVNGTVTERRREGVRRRVLCGFPMSTPLNEQAGEIVLDGDTPNTVAALNAEVESFLSNVVGSGGISCDVETFVPVEGTGIFNQTQKWMSFFTA